MKKKTYYLIFILLGGFFFWISPVKAQELQQLTVTLANARNEVKLDPGETHRFSMRLYNKSENPIVGSLKVVDFIVRDDKGTPVFLEDLKEPLENSFSAASWLTLPYERLAIAPNDKVTFDITIKVPVNARPGGHYAAVIFETSGTATPTNQSASSVSHRVAGLFYITVAGPVTEKAILTKLTLPSFAEYGPLKVETTISNQGDTHISPRGFLTVTDLFGKTITQNPLEEVNIFPGTTRSYENMVGEHFMAGRYKLTLTATYGQQGQIIEGYTYFWVVPWRIILSVTLALAIIILLLKNWRRQVINTEKELKEKLAEEEKEIERLKEELRKQS